MTKAIKLQFSQRDRYRVLIEIHLTPSISSRNCQYEIIDVLLIINLFQSLVRPFRRLVGHAAIT